MPPAATAPSATACRRRRRQLADQADCVSTPAEYVEAFKAREPRCVSPDLFGRVASGSSVEEAAFSSPYTSEKLAYFWSGADVLAKYMRIGYPRVRWQAADGASRQRRQYRGTSICCVQSADARMCVV